MGRTITMFATGIARSDGGIAAANRNVLAALEWLAARQDCALDVRILHEPAGTVRRVAVSGARVYERAYGGGKYAMALAIARAIAGSRLVVFDHVHLATPLVALGHLPRRLRARAAICAHGSESWKRIKPVCIETFRMADLTLTNSEYTLRRMRETFVGFTGIACPLGLPPQFALTAAPPERSIVGPVLTAADGTKRAIGERAMLLVGRMDAGEQEKGHRELIAALPSVLEQVPEAELVFVGGGSDAESIARIASASPAAARIFLPGRVDDNVLTALYGAAFAYIMPSRQEGFGLVYLEAMNHALPCLACHEDGAADVVADHETGVLIAQPIDQNELVAAIVGLLSDPVRARTLGEAGWRRLNEHFTAAAHQSRIEAALKPLLT
jgi:phosphatidylinositol alpha-1,6-mannosyltransferase